MGLEVRTAQLFKKTFLSDSAGNIPCWSLSLAAGLDFTLRRTTANDFLSVSELHDAHVATAHHATQTNNAPEQTPESPKHAAVRLLELLLGAKLVGVTALLLAAVHGAEVKTRVAPEGERGGTMYGENRASERSWSVETRNDQAMGGNHRQAK